MGSGGSHGGTVWSSKRPGCGLGRCDTHGGSRQMKQQLEAAALGPHCRHGGCGCWFVCTKQFGRDISSRQEIGERARTIACGAGWTGCSIPSPARPPAQYLDFQGCPGTLGDLVTPGEHHQTPQRRKMPANTSSVLRISMFQLTDCYVIDPRLPALPIYLQHSSFHMHPSRQPQPRPKPQRLE